MNFKCLFIISATNLIYDAVQLVKLKYIVDADDRMLCAVMSTGRFAASSRSVSPPHRSFAAVVAATVNINPGHGLSKDITWSSSDKLRASRCVVVPDLDVILTRLSIKYNLADLRMLVLESRNDVTHVIENK